MSDLDQITRNGFQTSRRLNDEALAGVQRRSNRRVLDVLTQTQDENARLLRERHALKKERDAAVELVRTLVDRSEAFRHLAIHLRDRWQPTDPNELPLKASLEPLFEAKERELAQDPGWARERDAGIERHLRTAVLSSLKR